MRPRIQPWGNCNLKPVQVFITNFLLLRNSLSQQFMQLLVPFLQRNSLNYSYIFQFGSLKANWWTQQNWAFKTTKSATFPVITGYPFPSCILRALCTHCTTILWITIDQEKTTVLIEKNRIGVHIVFFNKKFCCLSLHYCHSVTKHNKKIIQ